MVDIELNELDRTDIDVAPSSVGNVDPDLSWSGLKISHKNGIKYNLVVVTDDYNAVDNDDVIICQHTSTGTVTLPTPAQVGKQMTVKNETAYAITVWGGVEGASSYELTNENESIVVHWTGTTWSIVASHLIT